MADLASYESMELVTDLFLRELMRAPPPGFSKVRLDQLLRADRELFFELGHRCRTGVRRMPDGCRPFDVQIPLILGSPQFRYLLMPLPGASSKFQSLNDSGGRRSDANSKKRSQTSLEQSNADLRAQIKRFKAAQNGATDQNLTGGGGGGGGKGGGKGKGKGRSPKVPSGLVGKNFQTTHGEPICFAYNLSNMAVTRPRQAVGARVVSTCMPNRDARRIIAFSSIPLPTSDYRSPRVRTSTRTTSSSTLNLLCPSYLGSCSSN